MSVRWSPELEERLKALADGSLSAAKIAAELGMSRQAVIGKIHRGKGLFGALGATSSNPARKTKAVTMAAQSAPPAMEHIVVEREASVPAVNAPPLVPALPASDPVPFLVAISRGGCRFYCSDWLAPSGPNMPVCGAPVADPYAVPGDRARTHCAHHLRLASGGRPAARVKVA